MTWTFANQVTIARILLVPFFIATVMYMGPEHPHQRALALALFLVAIVSDIFDGYIARTHHQKTKAGAILDPLADKVLLISAFVCMYVEAAQFPVIHFPLWFVVGIISRDVILLIGSAIIQLNTGKLNIRANRYGKAAAFLQVACILGVLLQWSFTRWLWFPTLGVTVISGLIYIREGIRIINDNSIDHS